MSADQKSKKGRTLKISVYRHNVQDDVSKIKTYKISEVSGMTLYHALTEIREKQDSSLLFDFVCRQGECGSCAMLINGRPDLACRTLTKKLDAHINLAPLPVFDIVGDLSVNINQFTRLSDKLMESWVHTENQSADFDHIEAGIDPELINDVSVLESCLECGCCISACGAKRMNPDFVGPLAIKKMIRYLIDPRDKRIAEDYYKLIGHDNGIFGCLALAACEDICPKQIPLNSYAAFLRKKMAFAIRK